jgi:beta-N-acetylhexosaminidase
VRRSLLSTLLFLFLAAPAAAQTLEEMAGQMIVVGFAGSDATDKSVRAVAAEIASGGIGGVMYLKTNVKSLDSVRRMNRLFREASPDLAPFITLDQEGGLVERLTRDVGFKELPSAADVAKANSPAQAEKLYAPMAAQIADLGFTVNFGPVADLALNPGNQVIVRYGRAYGADPGTVVSYDQAFIDAHHAAGVVTSLKHFPGHGSSTADSHEGFVDITRSWKPTELEPYRQLIASGYADMVMAGHLYHADYDPSGEELPSSLSPAWLNGVLRGELGFDGVVISDDLEMGAVRDHFPLRERIVRAVKAGVDILLFSNTARPRSTIGAEIREILVSEAESDPAFRALIEASYRRIVALKARIGG